MNKLFTQEQYDSAKSREKILPFKCNHCNNIFYVTKHYFQQRTSPSASSRKNVLTYCSPKCKCSARTTKQKVNCKNCNIEFEKFPNQIKKTKNNFCTQSCAATYNNKHKTTGYRRSKLEIHLEEQIRVHYPDLNLVTSERKQLDGLELDFFFPDISLAIELNGIFHYQPIFGQEKFESIQNKDQRKFVLCDQKNIAFAVIDSSSCKYLNDSAKSKYWQITKTIIDKHLATI